MLPFYLHMLCLSWFIIRYHYVSGDFSDPVSFDLFFVGWLDM
jgi:hypothetical protein